MFKNLRHIKKNYFLIFIFLFINSTIFGLEKFNKFNYYRSYITYNTSESLTKYLWENEHLIIQNLIDDLGVEYKMRNYRIQGPNFTIIRFLKLRYKSEQKKGFINSKNIVRFEVGTVDQEKNFELEKDINKSFIKSIKILNKIYPINVFPSIYFNFRELCKEYLIVVDSDDRIIKYCSYIEREIHKNKKIIDNIILNFGNENFNDIEKISFDKSIRKLSFENTKELLGKIDITLNNLDNQIFKKKIANNIEYIHILLNNLERAIDGNIELNNDINILTKPNTFYTVNSFAGKVYVYSNFVFILLLLVFLYLKILINSKN
jgi:hypothetical protein